MKDDHLFQDCPWKDKTDLKFCGNCGVGEHSLEDCPVMLEKIMNKNNIQSSSCVENGNAVKYANVNIVTRQGTDTKNAEISKYNVNPQAHLDVTKQKEIFQDASQIFEELSHNDIRIGNSKKTLK